MSSQDKHIAMPKVAGAKCSGCPLRNRPLVKGFGAKPDDAKYVVVGEAPGRIEARYGVPFVGQSGQLIRAIMKFVGIDGGPTHDHGTMEEYIKELRENPGEVYFTNCALCNPPGNKINQKAAECCSARLDAELAPYLERGLPILAAGVTAGHKLVGYSEKSLRGRWYGNVVCTWHPAHVLRIPKQLSELIHDIRRLKRGKIEIPYPTWTVCNTEDQLRAYVDMLEGLPKDTVICYDLETEQLNFWEHQILCAAFAWNNNEAFVISPDLIYERGCAEQLIRLFNMEHLRFVGHNLKFDMKFMKHQMGVYNARVDYDTLIAHYVIDENMRHGLKQLLAEYFDIGDYEGELVQKYLRTRGDYYSKVPADKLMEYNVLDVCYNRRLWVDALEPALRADDLFDMPFIYPLMATQPIFTEMELRGMYVNRKRLEELSDEMGYAVEQVQIECEDMAGTEFNPNSWKQVGHIMYDIFGMPKVRGRGYKPGSTCKQARLSILNKIPPDSPGAAWLHKYDELKSLIKLKSSYVDNMFKYIDDDDHVHPDHLVYGTESGRISVRTPAIQTIPRTGTGSAMGDVWGAHIRGLFEARPGHKMVEVDISQAEMRVACALSMDPFLLDVYHNDRDLHSEVAIAMYGKNFKKDDRKICKMFNFAYLYGGTEHSFTLGEGMDLSVARAFVKKYRRVMKVLDAWKQEQLVLLKKQGYVSTRTGRRRRFPLINRDNHDDARKACVNTPVQGMASDITLITMMEVWNWLQDHNHDDTHLLTMIHDSVLLEVPDEKVDYISANVERIMEEVAVKWVPEVPWKIDTDVGSDWGHLKEYIRD